MKRAAVALALATQTAFLIVIGNAAQAGAIGSPQDLWSYFTGHWWGLAVGFLLPAAFRARQGRVAAQNTVNLPNGGSAVLIPPKGTV